MWEDIQFSSYIVAQCSVGGKGENLQYTDDQIFS